MQINTLKYTGLHFTIHYCKWKNTMVGLTVFTLCNLITHLLFWDVIPLYLLNSIRPVQWSHPSLYFCLQITSSFLWLRKNLLQNQHSHHSYWHNFLLFTWHWFLQSVAHIFFGCGGLEYTPKHTAHVIKMHKNSLQYFEVIAMLSR